MATRRPMPTIGPTRPKAPIAGLLLPPELPAAERRNKRVKISNTHFQPPKPGEILDNRAKVDGALLSYRVLQLLQTGHTYLDLSSELGLSPKEAFDAVVKAINAFMPNLQEMAKEVKDQELLKLDILEKQLREAMGPATSTITFDEDGNMKSPDSSLKDFIGCFLAIQKARRELLGLDAAKRMESKHEEIRRVYVGVDPDQGI